MYISRGKDDEDNDDEDEMEMERRGRGVSTKMVGRRPDRAKKDGRVTY